MRIGVVKVHLHHGDGHDGHHGSRGNHSRRRHGHGHTHTDRLGHRRCRWRRRLLSNSGGFGGGLLDATISVTTSVDVTWKRHTLVVTAQHCTPSALDLGLSLSFTAAWTVRASVFLSTRWCAQVVLWKRKYYTRVRCWEGKLLLMHCALRHSGKFSGSSRGVLWCMHAFSQSFLRGKKLRMHPIGHHSRITDEWDD